MLLMNCGVAFAVFSFKRNTNGYESLHNSTYFGAINNTTLNSILINYHDLVNQIAENEKSHNEYVVNQEAYLSNGFDRSLILASEFLPQNSLRTYQTPQPEYLEKYKF